MRYQTSRVEGMDVSGQVPEEQRQAQMTAERDQAIVAGNRENAARIQGELLGLKTVTFSKAVRPARIWSTARIKELSSPYNQLSGRHSDFLKAETDALAQARVASPVSHILHLAGVKGEGLPVMNPDSALETYTAARLVNEVGTFHVDNGGASFRTPDGHLHVFRLPTDEQKVGSLVSDLQEAGYRPGELPLVITNNPERNEQAFADQR